MRLRHLFAAFALTMALVVGGAAGAVAQTSGTIQGTVLDAETGEPIRNASISVVGTQRGSMTAQDGTFQISTVPQGTHQIRVVLLGYTSVTRSVTVAPGATAVLNFELVRSVIDLDEIVVTGVVGEMARGRLPFTVDRVSGASMPVQIAGNPASMLVGKVAGATIIGSSGRPGAPPSVQLRGPTSISLAGRNQDPLYIVDGVILSASIIDFDGLDIESIEVVKGAAASSLYGARAANGVIQITTHRGRNVADNQVRYSFRSEIGQSSLEGRANITQRHHFAMTEDRSQFLTAAGVPCDWLSCTNVGLAGQRSLGESAGLWNTIQREAWPGQTFDHVDLFFDPGLHMTNQATVSGRSGGTNYHLSLSRLQEDGVMDGHRGALRNTVRLNVDQSMRDDLTLSATMSFMRNSFDERDGPVFALTRMPAGIDLRAPDPNFPDHFVLKPDPNNDNSNPLNTIRAPRQNRADRTRFLGSVSGRWSPLSWLDLDGQFGFDRLDRNFSGDTPRGVRNLNGVPGIGSISRNHRRIEGITTAATARARHQFGDLNVMGSVRYLFEKDDDTFVSANSSEFIADGVFTIGNTPSDRRDASTSLQPERRDGFFVNTVFDYKDRYLLDALIRQDGNSRFGPDSRRAWYNRVGVSYLVSEEEWFDIPRVNNLGLRWARGTAGSAPSFSGQFETFSVGGGVITPGALGNRNLKPEVTTENEFGLDVGFGRVSADFTYARATTEDALLQVPLLAFAGFSTQWQNAASLKSNTVEISVSAQVVRTETTSWTSRLLFDRTRQAVTDMTVPPFTQGIPQQGIQSIFLVRPGTPLGTFFGFQFAQNCGHLPQNLQDRCGEFQVNGDGLLVYVGDAGSWQNGWQTFVDGDGQERHFWGAPTGVEVRGEELLWGKPFQAEDFDPLTGERTTFLPVGNTTPRFSMSWANTVTWNNLSIYGLFRTVQGFDIWNQPLQWATFQDYSGIMDQSRLPEDQQRPLGYFSTLYNASGLVPNSFFIEDGSFIKLQELRVAYRFGSEQLGRIGIARGVENLTLSVSGHNLFTWTDYDGYDPDIGLTGGGTGSAATARVDGFRHPPFRTFTFGFELTF